ncbi:MAG: type II toxin-antitoxin system Phd/YefM family antitoxin [Halorhodospira sp.]
MNVEGVSKSAFKARALEYFREIEASGGTIIVTDKGRPVIEVRRYRSDDRPPLERLQGSVVELSEPFEPVAQDDWEALR